MFPSKVYAERRQILKQKVGSGLIIIPGNNESPMNYPSNTYHFRQDSNFLYFFGLNYSGLAGIIDVDKNIDIIFGNDIDVEDIIWMGPQPSVSDLASQSGVEQTKPLGAFNEYLNQALSSKRAVHYLPPYRCDNKRMLSEMLGLKMELLKESASLSLIKAVVSMRSIKDDFEIEEIEKACNIGYEMHTAGMKAAEPGKYERQISGLVEGIALSMGSSVSFPVICSVHGETLHNHYHGNIMKSGDLLLLDAGAETPMNYCSDYTRTIPVSGTFSQKQREIYDLVCQANIHAIESVHPGKTYQSIHLKAASVITEGLKSLGLMQGNTEDAVQAGAHAMFFPHGLGHMMGLDVHDMEDLGENYVGYDEEISRIDQFGTAYLRLGRKLQPGFVLTVEPGIYFIPELISQWKHAGKFKEFINYNKAEEYLDFGGVRIEDDVLVTQNGSRILGRAVPKKSIEVEEFMKK